MDGTGSKLALGVATAGLSLLKTGVKGKAKGSEMIPIKNLTSVTTAKDGFRHVVRAVTTGNTIDFRVGTGEMEQVKQLLTELMLGRHASQQATTAAPSPPAPPPPPTSGPPAGGTTIRRGLAGSVGGMAPPGQSTTAAEATASFTRRE